MTSSFHLNPGRILRHLSVLLLGAVVLTACPAWADTDSPVGRWLVIDEDQVKEAIIQIDQVGDELRGKIVKIIPRPGHDNSDSCKNCDGDRKDQPILGMAMLWGFKQDESEWTGGSILDPDSGSIYSCTMRTTDHGQKLEVRGYILIPLLGRTQIWLREPKGGFKDSE